MDVFGLGTLSYLLLTGQPPATKRTELLARLAQENGLRPSTVADSITGVHRRADPGGDRAGARRSG